jgi:hypothetical protein
MAAGAAMALAALPAPAQAQCNHLSPRWLDSAGHFVPVAKKPIAAATEKSHGDRLTKKQPGRPAKPPPCQGCFNCGRNPANSPTTLTSGVQILELLCASTLSLQFLPFAEPVQTSSIGELLEPIFEIEHPPRRSA